MEPDLSNLTNPFINPPSLTDTREEGMFLTDAEIAGTSSSNVLNNTAVTIDQTIPKHLKEAYNNSFVSLTKPEILNTVPQRQLLENAQAVKNISKQMIQDAEQDADATLASQVLAENEIFIEHLQQKYNEFFAPGAIHQEQTEENVPTIASKLEENKIDQEGVKNAFTAIKNIAMQALVPKSYLSSNS